MQQKQKHLKLNPESENRQIISDAASVSVPLEGKWQNKPELPASKAD